MPVLVYVALGLAALVGAVVLWAVIEPHLIDVQRHDVYVSDLPAGWEGRRVALIADLQVGMWMANTSTIARIVRRIVRLEPAVTFIAGDFVYDAAGRPECARRAARLLKPLVEAGIPIYAVLGNHDYDMPTKDDPANVEAAETVRAAVEEVGIRVLENEAVALPNPSDGDGGALYLVGIGAHVPGHDRPDVALGRVPPGAPRLVMMHHPNTFESIPSGAAPLAVAGHTHGGQFRVPFMPERTWMTYTTDDKVHNDGFSEGFGATENTLYVNRGIGFSILPVRLNCPPELTLFTLRRRAAPRG